MKDLFVKLTLAERFALIPRLPQKGSYTLMARARELHDKLTPSPAEEKKFKIEDNAQTGRTTWSSESRTVTVEIAIGETMKDAIVKTLTELDKSGELNPGDVTLYEKFVKPEKPADDGASPRP